MCVKHGTPKAKLKFKANALWCPVEFVQQKMAAARAAGAPA